MLSPSLAFLSLRAVQWNAYHFSRHSCTVATHRQKVSRCPSRIVDAEFETVPEDTDEDGRREALEKSQMDMLESEPEASFLDMSINADPEISNLRIPFCDGEKCIDTKLSFMADLDGTQYAIGVPYDFAAAIALEKKNGEVVNLSPDSDENEEFMELMAQQLQEAVGDDLRLVRTPRVLTIAGPLDKYTKNWRDELLPKSVDTETLLNEDDEDIESFLSFMREELGEEEFTKTLNEEHTFDEETLSLFSVDDEDGLADFLKREMMDASSSEEDEYKERQKHIMEDVVGKLDLTHDGVALKLVSYGMPDGKSYSLVQLLQPVVLVAKQVEIGESSEHGKMTPQFDLLSRDELLLVSPRLEEVCREDIERLGWELEE